MEIPQDLFTWASFATLAGASGAVVVANNVLRHFFDPPPFPKFRRFLPLVLSLLVSFGGAAYSGALNGWSDWILGFFNGLLICAEAIGMNQTGYAVFRGKITPSWFG